MKHYDKEKLLELTNGGEDVYLAYLELEEESHGKYKHTLNPCYDDTKPSLVISYDQESEKFRHFDYGGSPDGIEYSGDCFDFIAQLFNLDVTEDFKKILEIICNKLNIEAEVIYEIEDFESVLRFGYELKKSDSGNLIKYFGKLGVNEKILKEYNVHEIEGYTTYIEGKPKFNSLRNFTIAYENVRFAKIYSPEPKKFWFVGTRSKDFLFGKQQIIRRLKKDRISGSLILTGGEKDTLTLTALGYNAVCLNSETATISEEVIGFMQLYEKVIVMYDNDTTGVKKSKSLIEKFSGKVNLVNYELPSELKENGGKDISDYVNLGLSIEKIHSEISLICELKENIEMNDEFQHEGLLQKDNIDESKVNLVEENCEKDMTFLSKNIFENLPEVLKIATEDFSERREKDLVLLSCLGVLSSLFPSVKGIYGGYEIGCNIYLIISAPAASGKGAMGWSRILGNGVQKQINVNYTKSYEKYKSELSNYKRNWKSDLSISKPIVPKIQSLFIPANTSVSKLINTLEANVNYGLLFETEIDTLTNALNSELSDFSDILRKAFHHESISKSRIAEGESVEVRKPQLSVVMSGTPNQVKNLIGSVENGFFSRFLFCDFDDANGWVNQFISTDNKREQIFEGISDYISESWENNAENIKCIVLLSESQILKLNEYFSSKFERLLAQYGDDIVASVKRTGMICYRIAMILTVMRALEDKMKLPPTMIVSDKDFHIALSIVDSSFYSLEKVFKRMRKNKINQKMNNQQREIYDKLPEDFTKELYTSVVTTLEYNQFTGEKYLTDLIDKGLIERIRHGNYKKLSK